MLYDNALLARIYLHAWILTSEGSQAVTGNEFLRTITEKNLEIERALGNALWR